MDPGAGFQRRAALLAALALPLTFLALVTALDGLTTRRHGVLLAILLGLMIAVVQGLPILAVLRPAAWQPRLGRREVTLAIGVMGVTIAGVWMLDAVLGARHRALSDARLAQEYRRRDTVRNHALTNGAVGAMQTPNGIVDYRINEFGQRGPSFELRKKPGEVRVMMLGDSFAEGWQVAEDQSVAHLLRQKLAAQDTEAAKHDLINAAVASYSPMLEDLYLRHEGFAFDPDLVLLFWDLADLQDDWGRALFAIRDATGKVLAVGPEPLAPEAVRPAAGQRLREFLQGGPVAGVFGTFFAIQPPQEAEPVYDDAFLSQVFQGDVEAFRYPGKLRMINTFPGIGDALEPAWQVTESSFASLFATCRELDVPLVVVLYPYGHLLGPHEWTQGRRHFGIGPDATGSDDSFKRVEAICAQAGVPVINTLAAMQAASDPNRPNTLFYADDPHWTPEGNRMVADEVARQLTERNLLPPPRAPRFHRWKEQ